MPTFPIVDSHVHLYDVDRLRYGWLAAVPKIDRTYGLADFDAARGPVEVDGIVFAEVAVDPGLHLEEARHVQGLADRDPRLCGMVAHAPLEKGPSVEADILALEGECDAPRHPPSDRDRARPLLLPRRALPRRACAFFPATA